MKIVLPLLLKRKTSSNIGAFSDSENAVYARGLLDISFGSDENHDGKNNSPVSEIEFCIHFYFRNFKHV